MEKNKIFSKLPSVDKILSNSRIINLIEDYPRKLILETVREKINQKREEIISLYEDGINSFDIDEDDLVTEIINYTKSKFELSIKKV